MSTAAGDYQARFAEHAAGKTRYKFSRKKNHSGWCGCYGEATEGEPVYADCPACNPCDGRCDECQQDFTGKRAPFWWLQKEQ